ncbi:MAG: ABC transporter ATP-binding protein [Ruminococcus sp.]|nr:ABC transporter ATP-binding protein [Ruminococcus sp.]
MVEAKNVSIRYLAGDFADVGLKEWTIQRIKRERRIAPVWAVDDVSFKLEKGDFMGIIGVNGAGKSTLLKSVTGILPPKKGSIVTEGNVVALLELGTGFDGDLNLHENILMRGALLGYEKDFIESKIQEILEFAELTDFQWYKYKQLSSGMRSRLAFSICCMVRPDVLILDEVLSVGDGSFRQKSSEKMLEIINNGAITLFVGHNTVTMKKLANKLLWLDKGKQIAFAQNREETLELLAKYDRFLKERAVNPKAVPDLSPLPNLPLKRNPDQPISYAEYERMNRYAKAKEQRLRTYMDFLDMLVREPQRIQNMRKYLKKRDITHLAVYGDNAILKTVVPLLKQAGVKLDYIVENVKKSEHCDTVYQRSITEFPDTQLILIADMMYTEKIQEKLPSLTEIPFCTMNELFA